MIAETSPLHVLNTRLAPAAAAQPREMTAADALAARGWQLSPATGSGCQVTETGQSCGAEVRHLISGPYGEHAWVCQHHYGTLCKLIRAAERRPA